MTHAEPTNAASSASNPAPPAAPASAGERRVALLGADRPCTRCGYNLVGQPVVREPVYDMLIVRCPECGTAAGLLEYPLLGRWVGRWIMLLAALWLLVQLALLAMTAGIGTGVVMSTGDLVSSPIKQQVWSEFSQWHERENLLEQNRLIEAAAAAGTTLNPAQSVPTQLWQMSTDQIDAVLIRWWDSQGGEAGYVASKGGWRAIVPWWASLYLLGMTLLAAGLGAVWSLATLGLPRRRLWSVWLVIVAATCVMTLFLLHAQGQFDSMRNFGNWMQQLARFAERRLDWPGRAAGLLGFLVGIALGLLWGRALTRMLVTILLPPRLRWGLAILWTAEGLKPPGAI